tara:strand:+ start:7286 stop:7528 length:243 start_codon:yes stop_codon:yes gene_type:complete
MSGDHFEFQGYEFNQYFLNQTNLLDKYVKSQIPLKIAKNYYCLKGDKFDKNLLNNDRLNPQCCKLEVLKFIFCGLIENKK